MPSSLAASIGLAVVLGCLSLRERRYRTDRSPAISSGALILRVLSTRTFAEDRFLVGFELQPGSPVDQTGPLKGLETVLSCFILK